MSRKCLPLYLSISRVRMIMEIERHRARNEQQSGKTGKILAFRGKLPQKARQVSPIRRQVVASHTVICGNFPDFSTTSLPEKPCLWAFRAARREKSAFLLRKQPPPPYAPKRLAPLAIAEYVTVFLSHRMGIVVGAWSKRGMGSSEPHPRYWRLYGVTISSP